MSRVYEVAWDWSSEAALFLVYDGHTIEEVMASYDDEMENIDIRDRNVTDITEYDFINYGGPILDDNGNRIGRVITKDDMLQELDPYMPSDLVRMLRSY